MDNLGKLLLFKDVVEAGGFSRAGRRRGLSHSTVSKHIKSLEAQLGVLLLNRTSRSTSLTEAGAVVLEYSQRVSASVEALHARLDGLREEVVGELSISCQARVGSSLVQPAIATYLQEFPRSKVRLVVEDGPLNFNRDGFDLAVRVGLHAEGSLTASKLMDNEVCFVGAPSLLARVRPPEHPSDFSKLPTVGYKSSLVEVSTWSYLDAEGLHTISVDHSCRVNNGDAMLDLVLRGVGFGYVSLLAAEEYIRRGLLVRLLPEYQTPLFAPVFVFFASSPHPSPKLEAFKRHLQAAAQATLTETRAPVLFRTAAVLCVRFLYTQRAATEAHPPKRRGKRRLVMTTALQTIGSPKTPRQVLGFAVLLASAACASTGQTATGEEAAAAQAAPTRINLQNTPDPESIVRTPVEFESGGNTLKGLLFAPKAVTGPLPGVVVTGSWTSVKEQMAGTYARELAKRGMVALVFDFTGWGASEGTPRYVEDPAQKTADIEAAVRFLATRAEVDKSALSGLGVCASAGYMAAAAAADDKLKRLALVAPWLHDPKMAEQIYGGPEGVAKLIAAGEAAKASGDSTILAESTTDKTALMYQAPYYTEPERGLIKAYDNKFDLRSWGPWLTYDAQASADALKVATLIISSDAAAIPQGAHAYAARTKAPVTERWFDNVAQYDFYDRADVVKAASDIVAAFLEDKPLPAEAPAR